MQVFAMKVQKVAQLLKQKLLDRARIEMKILLSLHHPFLVRLHYCFVDNNQLCMLLDFCEGGHPSSLLHLMSCLSLHLTFMLLLGLRDSFTHRCSSVGIFHFALVPVCC